MTMITEDTRARQLERLSAATATLPPIEVARVLGRSQSSVYALIDRGELGDPTVSPTGRLGVPVEAVRSFIVRGGGAMG